MTIPGVSFANPGAWWLLLAIPVLIVGGRILVRRHTPPWLDALRGVILVLLVLTLAGPIIIQGAQNATTIFVVDRSASIQPATAETANAWVTNALSQAGSGQDAAVITFGAEPTLAQGAAPAHTLTNDWLTTPPQGEATDLASALSLARSLPVGDSRHVVVLSDGEETTGHAIEEADQAAAEGVVIDVVPLPGIDAGDLRIERLDGPNSVWQGENVSLVAHVTVGGGGLVTLDVTVDGTMSQTMDVRLEPGSNIVPITVPALSPGFHAIDVEVSGPPEIDRVTGNNIAHLGTVVRDQPQALLVSPIGADSSRLEQALLAEGAAVQVVTPDQFPARASDLAGIDAVILNNVPAWDLSTSQQSIIAGHTRNGNGLVVIGGSAAYGPGSYAGTPLEDALPVTVKVVDGQRRPSVAVLIIMDRSGSMSYDPREGTTTKLNLAKTGVVTAASALGPGDQLGVIAFNDEPHWALPMMTLSGTGDLGLVEDAMAPLTAEGGTELYPALQVGYDRLRNVDTDVRHIILLSDGKSRSGTRETYTRLVTELGGDNITLSTVAVGSDADIDLLQFLATTGHGRYHFANVPSEIPQITFEEAQNAGSQSVLRGDFTPVQRQASPILNEIDLAGMPAIDGYNFAEGRANAQVDLVSDRGDPLLAKWQLGLGRVVAWTADDGSDYATEWSSWAQYDQFWGEAFRWTLPDPDNQAVTASVVAEGEGARLVLDSQQASGESIDLSDTDIILTQPGNDPIRVRPQPVLPGRYELFVPEVQSGTWRIDVTSPPTTLATALSPPAEWQPAGHGHDLLQLLAGRTGGVEHSLDTPAGMGIFTTSGSDGGAPGVATPVWYYPLLLALVLFVLEIGLRQSRLWAEDPDGNSTTA